MPETIKPRLLMVDTEFGYADLWKDLFKAFKSWFDVAMVGYNEDDRKIGKFDPEYVFYFQDLRANTHLRTVDKKRYLRTVCWIVDDTTRLDENVDAGALYDFVLTADHGGYKARKDFGHRNVYYMPPCVNTSFFYPNRRPGEHILFINRGGRLDQLIASVPEGVKYEAVDASRVGRHELGEIINSAAYVVEADQRATTVNANKIKAETPFSGLEALACRRPFLFEDRFDPAALGLKFRDEFMTSSYKGYEFLENVIGQAGIAEAERLAENAYNTVTRNHTVERRVEEIKNLITRK